GWVQEDAVRSQAICVHVQRVAGAERVDQDMVAGYSIKQDLAMPVAAAKIVQDHEVRRTAIDSKGSVGKVEGRHVEYSVAKRIEHASAGSQRSAAGDGNGRACLKGERCRIRVNGGEGRRHGRGVGDDPSSDSAATADRERT